MPGPEAPKPDPGAAPRVFTVNAQTPARPAVKVFTLTRTYKDSVLTAAI
jgi:hypothetical protein